ncbi:MAG TPA: CAP domain-containing protein [Microthrixaceae bacterium]|nr:CAP domain-containing protein [Microthrixaceae bacterium]
MNTTSNRTRTLAVGAICALAAALTACGAAPVSPPTTASPTSSTVPGSPTSDAWRQEMLANLNAQRATAGLAPLALCNSLTTAAQNQSNAQAAQNRMFHADLKTNAEAAGYRGWRLLAENVAAGQRSVNEVMTSWMNSSGHRANILGGSEHVGFGRATGSSGTIFWTQSFGAGGTC